MSHETTSRAASEALDAAVHELRELRVDRAVSAQASSDFFGRMDASALQNTQAASTKRRGSWLRLPAAMILAAAAAAFLTWHLAKTFPASDVEGSHETTNSLAERQAIATHETKSEIVQLGDRVAVAAGVTSHYAVLSVAPSQTTLRLWQGAVSVRLYPSEKPYELVVRTSQYSFAATGTVYSVEESAAGARLTVHEGSVAVRDSEGILVASIPAGETWPPGKAFVAETKQAALALLQYAPPPPLEPGVIVPPSAPSAKAMRAKAPAAPNLPQIPEEVESNAQKWQRARLLRGQAKVAASITILKELAASTDTTWAPLALIEEIRIHSEAPAGIKNNSERVRALGREFSERFLDHPLRDEVAAIVCPALARGGEDASVVLCQPKR